MPRRVLSFLFSQRSTICIFLDHATYRSSFQIYGCKIIYGSLMVPKTSTISNSYLLLISNDVYLCLCLLVTSVEDGLFSYFIFSKKFFDSHFVFLILFCS